MSDTKSVLNNIVISRRNFVAISVSSILIYHPIVKANPFALRAIGAVFRVFLSGSRPLNAFKWARRGSRLYRSRKYTKMQRDVLFKEIAKDMIGDGIEDFVVEKLRELLNTNDPKIFSATPAYLISSLSDKELDVFFKTDIPWRKSTHTAPILLHIENNTDTTLSDRINIRLIDVDSKKTETEFQLTINVEKNHTRIFQVNLLNFKNSGKKQIICENLKDNKHRIFIPSKEFIVT